MGYRVLRLRADTVLDVTKYVAIPSDEPANAVTLWVIHNRPLDYPHGYVLRPQFVNREGQRVSRDAWYSSTYGELIELLPEGLVPLGRQPDDVPSIVGVWV